MKYLVSIALMLGLAGCQADVTDTSDNTAREILDVADSNPAPDEAGQVAGGAPQSLSGIMKVSDIDFAAYDKDLASWMGLEIGMPMQEAEVEVLNRMAPEKGGEGNAVFEMDKLQGYVGGQAFIATIDRMADDSVKAQQLYAIGKKGEGETYTLVDYGLRVKCWRGDNKDNWQTDLCP